MRPASALDRPSPFLVVGLEEVPPIRPDGVVPARVAVSVPGTAVVRPVVRVLGQVPPALEEATTPGAGGLLETLPGAGRLLDRPACVAVRAADDVVSPDADATAAPVRRDLRLGAAGRAVHGVDAHVTPERRLADVVTARVAGDTQPVPALRRHLFCH